MVPLILCIHWSIPACALTGEGTATWCIWTALTAELPCQDLAVLFSLKGTPDDRVQVSLQGEVLGRLLRGNVLEKDPEAFRVRPARAPEGQLEGKVHTVGEAPPVSRGQRERSDPGGQHGVRGERRATFPPQPCPLQSSHLPGPPLCPIFEPRLNPGGVQRGAWGLVWRVRVALAASRPQP